MERKIQLRNGLRLFCLMIFPGIRGSGAGEAGGIRIAGNRDGKAAVAGDINGAVGTHDGNGLAALISRAWEAFCGFSGRCRPFLWMVLV